MFASLIHTNILSVDEVNKSIATCKFANSYHDDIYCVLNNLTYMYFKHRMLSLLCHVLSLRVRRLRKFSFWRCWNVPKGLILWKLWTRHQPQRWSVICPVESAVTGNRWTLLRACCCVFRAAAVCSLWSWRSKRNLWPHNLPPSPLFLTDIYIQYLLLHRHTTSPLDWLNSRWLKPPELWAVDLSSLYFRKNLSIPSLYPWAVNCMADSFESCEKKLVRGKWMWLAEGGYWRVCGPWIQTSCGWAAVCGSGGSRGCNWSSQNSNHCSSPASGRERRSGSFGQAWDSSALRDCRRTDTIINMATMNVASTVDLKAGIIHTNLNSGLSWWICAPNFMVIHSTVAETFHSGANTVVPRDRPIEGLKPLFNNIKINIRCKHTNIKPP